MSNVFVRYLEEAAGKPSTVKGGGISYHLKALHHHATEFNRAQNELYGEGSISERNPFQHQDLSRNSDYHERKMGEHIEALQKLKRKDQDLSKHPDWTAMVSDYIHPTTGEPI